MPGRHVYYQLNSYLAHNQQSRQQYQVQPEVVWDIREPSDNARGATTGRRISSRVRQQFATNPPCADFRIACGIFPSKSWYIEIHKRSGVTVGDVLDGLYSGLRHRISKTEWTYMAHTTQSRVAEAFYDRQRRSKDPRYEHQAGLRRIDYMLRSSSFVGLSPSPEYPNTWMLTTRRINRH